MTFPCPQITLDLENNSISTKGTKSGAFVMYNCARLATLFNAFQQAVEQGEHQPHHPLPQPLLEPQGLLRAQQSPCFPGTYPPLPPVSELNFSCLREEVSAERRNGGICAPLALVMGATGPGGSDTEKHNLCTGRMAPALQLSPALP